MTIFPLPPSLSLPLSPSLSLFISLFIRRALVSDVCPIIRPRSLSLGNARARIRVMSHVIPRSVVAAIPPSAQQGKTGDRRQPAFLAGPSSAPFFSTANSGPAFLHSRSYGVGDDNSDPPKDGVALYVTVQAALHINCSPGQYLLVTYEKDDSHIRTHAVEGSPSKSALSSTAGTAFSPSWDHRRCIYVHESGHWSDIAFKVWRRSDDNADDPSNDLYVGQACVDLDALRVGLTEVCGWYHIVDARGVRQGQLKVCI